MNKKKTFFLLYTNKTSLINLMIIVIGARYLGKMFIITNFFTFNGCVILFVGRNLVGS